MLHWEFEHIALADRRFWVWRALKSDGRAWRRSKRPFTSFLGAMDDASRHGFHRGRDAWRLAPPAFRLGPLRSLPRSRKAGGVLPAGRIVRSRGTRRAEGT